MANDPPQHASFGRPINLFDTFASPTTANFGLPDASGSTAGSIIPDTATTVPLGILEYIRREIAQQTQRSRSSGLTSDDPALVAFIQQQIAVAVAAGPRQSLSRTQNNRLLAEKHIGLQRNDPDYVLPPGALITDSDLDAFRMAQRDPRFFSSVLWSDTNWCFPPNHVEVLSDDEAAAAAFATLVAKYPVAYSAAPLSEAAIL
jgi:hypothetical protein